MVCSENNMASEKQTKQSIRKDSKNFYYSACFRQVLYIIQIIIITAICLTIIPYILLGFFHLAACDPWFTDTVDNNINGLSLLPDFLGGIMGVIIGFMIDGFFIDKIKYLSKYRALSIELNAELWNILCDPNYGKENFYEFLFNIFNNFSKKWITATELNHYLEENANVLNSLIEYYTDKKIKVYILDDIVTSIDNDVLFIKLPTYRVIIDKKFVCKNAFIEKLDGHNVLPKITISNLLHRISKLINEFNNICKAKEREKNLILIYAYIIRVLLFTDKNTLLRFNKENSPN